MHVFEPVFQVRWRDQSGTTKSSKSISIHSFNCFRAEMAYQKTSFLSEELLMDVCVGDEDEDPEGVVFVIEDGTISMEEGQFGNENILVVLEDDSQSSASVALSTDEMNIVTNAPANDHQSTAKVFIEDEPGSGAPDENESGMF
jgi:hypothetical protein